MPFIEIEFQTDDPRMRELCQLYWEVDGYGKFVHRVADFAEKFGLKAREVAKEVRQHCRAFRADLLCESCGAHVKYLDNRSDVSLGWRSRDWYRYCDTCEDAIQSQEEERRRQQDEILNQQKLEKMQEAFEGGVYESLSLLEFNFLVALATSPNTDVARKKNSAYPRKTLNQSSKS
ncbi:hypothetical protein D6817_05370 [Candidatus Pacearchaeota archaeon]|nr:MAG: hypothetical protein D6817_05370 [Candidatus Pacearchaeota archaeon]